MATGKFVAYYRVSTQKQGRSGLGLEAQQASVTAYLNGGDWQLLESFTEIESGKDTGKAGARPELTKALHLAKVTNATLIVAKLDRLTRDLHFITSLQKAGVRFVAADNPDANELTVHILVAMAQHERELISRRTKEALQAAQARGTKLGNPNGAAALLRAGKGNGAALSAIKSQADGKAADLKPIIDQLRSEGFTSLRQIAAELTSRGIETARGLTVWHPNSVRQLLARMG